MQSTIITKEIKKIFFLKGTLDGNGFSIMGLSISNNSIYVGLIAFGYSATIKNITFLDINITSSNYYVSGIFGYCQNCTFDSVRLFLDEKKNRIIISILIR